MLVLGLVSLILHSSMRLLVSQCFHCVKTDNVQKNVFSAKQRVLAHLTSFLLKNAVKRRHILVLGLVSLILRNSMRLHVSQCFHCVKTNKVQKTRFQREITRFSAFNVVLLKNAFKRRDMLVSGLVCLILRNSMRLHVSQCFHCVKTDNVQKTRF